MQWQTHQMLMFLDQAHQAQQVSYLLHFATQMLLLCTPP